jgi:plasmid stability protein
MPDILIRGLDEKTLLRLKSQAKKNGRSLQSEAKRLLESGAALTMAEALAVGAKWRKKLSGPLDDSTSLIREDRRR